jgi:hypothetical protein
MTVLTAPGNRPRQWVQQLHVPLVPRFAAGGPAGQGATMNVGRDSTEWKVHRFTRRLVGRMRRSLQRLAVLISRVPRFRTTREEAPTMCYYLD